MSKTPPKADDISKVVPLTQEKHRLIARDEESQRVIIVIGRRRIALDFFTRVTDLPQGTGDQPAPVLPMSKDPQNPAKKEK